MKAIILTFTFKNERFCICAFNSVTKKRSYKAIVNLVEPDFSTWNQKTQRFEGNTSLIRHNNLVLERTKEFYEKKIISGIHIDCKELFSCDPDNLPKQKAYSVQDFLYDLIAEMKNPTNRKPTKTVQNYITLLHALEKEGKVWNTSLELVTDEEFKQFGEWIKTREVSNGKGNNYLALMKSFKAMINKAVDKELTTAVLRYKFRNDMPSHEEQPISAQNLYDYGGNVKSLSPEQYQSFVECNIQVDCNENGENATELYKDFCVLMYEMKMRPMDMIKLHWDNIAYAQDLQRYVCMYIPAKKRNHKITKKSNPQAIQFISKKAEEIIMKYKGVSAGQYVLPLRMNEKRWNLDDASEFHKFYIQCNKTEGKINKYLHKIGNHLQLPFKFTLYVLRRSAITHEIMKNKMPLSLIAKTAGTSSEMIENHYTNVLQALSKFL